jgi:hypothetical protein
MNSSSKLTGHLDYGSQFSEDDSFDSDIMVIGGGFKRRKYSALNRVSFILIWMIFVLCISCIAGSITPVLIINLFEPRNEMVLLISWRLQIMAVVLLPVVVLEQWRRKEVVRWRLKRVHFWIFGDLLVAGGMYVCMVVGCTDTPIGDGYTLTTIFPDFCGGD